MYLISSTNGTMWVNTAQSILGLHTIDRVAVQRSGFANAVVHGGPAL